MSSEPIPNYAASSPNINDMEVYPSSRPFAQPNETFITTFQSGHGFAKTSTNGSVADDTTDYILGSQSFKLTTPNDASSIFADKNISSTDITGKYISFWFKTDNIYAISELWVMLSSESDFSARYTFKVDLDKSIYKTNDTWQRITFSIANAAVTGSIDEEAVDYVRVRATAVTGNVAHVWFNSIGLVSERTAAVCSLTFDDGLDSVWTKAKPKLDAYGFKGTAYITPHQIGDSERLTLDQCKTLYDLGWDISGHQEGSMLTKTNGFIQDYCRKVKRWLIDNGFNRSADQYAYSNGHYTETQMPIYRKWWRSCRTIAEYQETYPPADPHRLRIYNITEGDSTATVATAVTAAINNKSWIIFCFHGIKDTVTDSSTQTSTSKFNTIIDDIATQGIRVLPVSAVTNGDT